MAVLLTSTCEFYSVSWTRIFSRAMKLVLQVLATDLDNNDQLVVFFGRGTYYDGATNCCDNPDASAAAVRSKATVQGVVIG